MKMVDNLKKKSRIYFILIVLLATLFFVFTSFFAVLPKKAGGCVETGAQVKFSSPDETLNYFWIEKLAKTGELYYFEELNGVGTSLIHPRSVNTVEGKVVPGSFFGMILVYAFFTKTLSSSIILFLTPFFSALGMVIFYLLLKRVVIEKMAFIASVLWMILPATMYYTAKGMYHNMFFVVMLLLGVYMAILAFEKKDKGWFALVLYTLSGLFFGLSITTRTAEIVWVFFVWLVLFAFNYKRVNWLGLVYFATGFYVPVLMLFYYNMIIYGSVISVGYKAVIGEGGVGGIVKNGVLFQMLVSPFGFNLENIINNAWSYLVAFFDQWSYLFLIGFVFFAISGKKYLKTTHKAKWTILLFAFLASLYLVVFYGSWQFTDRIDESSLSLGTSYLRYWMPVYIIMLPFVAIAFVVLAECIASLVNRSRELLIWFVVAIFILALATPTLGLTLRSTDESLVILNGLVEAKIKSDIVNKKINVDDVVVIYRQADKIFFPSRDNIITELVVPANYEALRNLVKVRDVYLYTFVPKRDIEFLSRRDYEQYGIRIDIESGEQVYQREWLYKFELID